METYSYYTESGESSPLSRDVDFDNQLQPWDQDQSVTPTNGYKVKFMCSYGGKIHPRPHDNQLSYVGGETKILAVNRFVKFAAVMSKLTALCDGDHVSFKYQLPGEDLDALISVTNDDDLQHMMHEYDRLNRASSIPARLRLFLFPVSGQSPALTPVHSFGSTEGRSEREGLFMDGLNLQSHTPPSMFGLDKGMPSGLIMSRPRDHQIGDLQDIETAAVDDERGNEADQIQKRIQKLQINAEEQRPAPLYRKPSDDNLAAAGYPGEYHVPRMTSEKVAPATGYQISPDQQQPVYMINHQTPASMYMPRPAVVNHGQGYYVQRMPTEVYREQPVYNVVMPAAQPVSVAVATQQTTVSSQQQFGQQNVATYTEGYRMVQSNTDGQAVAYHDNATGRQIYYTNHGGAGGGGGVLAQPQHPLQLATAQQYQAMTAAAAATSNIIEINAGNANIKELI